MRIERDVLTGRMAGPDGRPLPVAEGWGSAAKPLRLRFVPSSDQAQSGPSIERIVSFLRDRTGYHVEGATMGSYGLVIEEIASGRCEVAFLTAASYARAWYATSRNDDPRDDVDAFLQVVRRGSPRYPGSDLAYRAALIVRTDSPIRSVEDVTDATTVALGGKTSGAGSVLPSALFHRLGIHPRTHHFEGSYPVIVSAVLQGSAEVGSVWWSPPNAELPRNDGRLTLAESVPDVFERTRIIGFSAWLPNEPVVVRSVIPEDVRRVLARALSLYVSLRTLTEEGRKELATVGSPVAFIPATNEDMKPILEVIQQAFADDPEGLRDFMAGR